jgi:hypothetical protein
MRDFIFLFSFLVMCFVMPVANAGLTQYGPAGTVTTVTGSAPISSSGGTTPALSCISASATVGGCLTNGTQSIEGTKTFVTGVSTPIMLVTNVLTLPVSGLGVTPSGNSAGQLALTSVWILCVYTGVAWKEVSSIGTTCTF